MAITVTRHGINPHLASLQLAWHIMGKTSAELVDMVEQLEKEGVLDRLLDGIGATERQMRGRYELANAAKARLFCAATVVTLRRGAQAMCLILLLRLAALLRMVAHDNARAALLMKWSDEACDRVEQRTRQANAIAVRLGFAPIQYPSPAACTIGYLATLPDAATSPARPHDSRSRNPVQAAWLM